MNKQLFAFIILLVFTVSCVQQEKIKDESRLTSTQIPKIETDSSKIYKQEAMRLLDEVNSTMQKAIKGELSQQATNDEINPKMDKFFKLIKKMSPVDTLDVHNYRVQELNKIIDLQMGQNQR